MANTLTARRATTLAAVAAVVAGAGAVTIASPGAAYSAAGHRRVTLAATPTPTPTSLSTAAAAAVPVLASLTPTAGTVDGGGYVTILGSGFITQGSSDVPTVSFGDVPSETVRVLTDAKLVAQVPAGTAGTVKVTVSNAAGKSINPNATYAYRSALGLTFNDVTARLAGGTAFTAEVTGDTVGSTAKAFAALKITVKVGGVAGTVTWVDATHVKINIPAAGTSGSATVQLFQDGYAGPESTAKVLYPAVVGAVAPAKVSTDGGVTVKITGLGFLGVDTTDPASVTFGGDPATSFEVVSNTVITAVTPARANGTAAVAVTTKGGTSAEATGAKVAYRSALTLDTSVSGTQLPAGGGPYLLTISGGTLGADVKAYAAEAVSVQMGKTKLGATYVDPTHMRVTLPTITAASVDLTVLHDTIAGTPTTFTVAPVVTALSIAADTLAGGKKVVVKVAGAEVAAATDFKFGENAATCTSSGTGTAVVFTCVVPPATQAGPVAVTFTSGTGTASRYTAAATFSYTDID
ncbi:IPT/TIG domain-containing protein [Actinoplanes sp. NBRC 101535]|uniref:IPT/TIG domain-containing protein n=1 Tax=Actinoplanes sp. NBRC 101535 TaxID=3032196 RepID=UPI0024A00093|nr:IPT/TIG domain-containing protein [Actinoplanes sp. NBRC 101535]GLY01828.1 hypothetical protein Acsp01_22070 [Actinoplanes sp. NBRC 101535]